MTRAHFRSGRDPGCLRVGHMDRRHGRRGVAFKVQAEARAGAYTSLGKPWNWARKRKSRGEEMGQVGRDQVMENLDSHPNYHQSCRLLSAYYVPGIWLSA